MRSSASGYWSRYISPEGPARLWVRPSWSGDAGLRHLLIVALPMILSALSASVNLFFDRLFLAHFDRNAHLPASMSAGTVWWTSQTLVMGIVTYVGTFVAQYHGAKQPHRIGASVWQGIYMSILGGAIAIAMIPFAGPFFRFTGHAGNLPALEAEYFGVLCLGAVFLHVNGALSSFYTGRGKVNLVMVISFIIAGANIGLNKWLIFNPPSWAPFIQPGLVGAAWGTILSMALGTVIFTACVLTPQNRREFGTLSAWRFRPDLFRRLLHYGMPQGFQFIIDMSAFSIFILAVGRVSQEALTATTIAMNINMLLFIPMVGMAQALSVLVGQFVGAERVDLAERITCVGFLVCFLYMVVVSASYVLIPGIYIDMFRDKTTVDASFAAVESMARVFLIFVAVYSLFDAFALSYSGSIKGAGDTRFVLKLSVFNSLLVMIIPIIVAVKMGAPATVLWGFITLFIIIMGTGMMLRYRSGFWKSMKVIETEPPLSLDEPPNDAAMATG
ncbi:MATE family efflux transporter [bacterium]|nr:MATE family efflux transporter [bacterium]